jgi:hypothetical protein
MWNVGTIQLHWNWERMHGYMNMGTGTSHDTGGHF